MRRKSYPSDLSDEEWAKLKPHLPTHERGAPRRVNMREVINALRYLSRTGCQWRMLPHDLPPWEKVYYYFSQWRNDGTWERINRELRIEVRVNAGKDPEPSAAILDSQSVKSTEMGEARGYDAGKKVNGIKRHLLVDTLGLVLTVMVLTGGHSRPRWRTPSLGKGQRTISTSPEDLGRRWLYRHLGRMGQAVLPLGSGYCQAQ